MITKVEEKNSLFMDEEDEIIEPEDAAQASGKEAPLPGESPPGGLPGLDLGGSLPPPPPSPSAPPSPPVPPTP